MQDDSTEALASSQLETLYRLGILERSSEDEEQDRRRNSESGLNQRHDSFLAALPPPSAGYLLPPRMLQSSIDISDSSEFSGSSRSGDFDARSSSGASLQSLRQRQRSRPRRSRSLRPSGSSKASFALPVKQSSTRNSRTLRVWFKQWRRFVRRRREKARRQAKADVFFKQSAVTKWACFLKQRREEHDKMRILDAWKVSRAISQWVQWKQRCRLLRTLLNGGRSSFLGRLTLQRVWRRWLQFSKRRKYVEDAIARRTCYRHRRLVCSAWTQLRIHAFRARQDCLALHRCLKCLRSFCDIQEQQRQMCIQLQQKVLLGRERELLQRWRTFAYTSGRDKRLVRRVQFSIRRRRYFLLWCEVARTVNDVMQLREKISFRELLQHFLAWRMTVRAIRFGERVRKTREMRLRVMYFGAFKDQATFSVYCHCASLTLAHRRLSVAVSYLHAWATERRHRRDGVRRIRQMWQTRLLRRVWLTGWLRVHRKRLVVQHYHLSLRVRYFDAWKQFHRKRQMYYLQQERAEALHSKLCCRRSLAGWKMYYKLRLEHAQELVRAQEYYRMHLLQQGVAILWGAVYQNTQNSLRGHQLRQNLRISLKKHHFHAWRVLTRSRREFAERLYHLQRSSDYQKSICNPSRRTWNRWIMFVSLCRRRHRCDQHFQLRMKRQVLFDWHGQAQLESGLRLFNFHRRMKRLELSFDHWKSRVEKWRKVGVICELAEKVYERKLCTRVIRDWRHRSAYFHRVRLCGDFLRHLRQTKLQAKWFTEWRMKFDVRRCFSKIRRCRERQYIRTCFTNWHRYSVQQKAFNRKLTYFQHVYGKYPASSVVSRAWRRWQLVSNGSRDLKVLHRKHQLKQARKCWSHWKLFHAARQLLRAWSWLARRMASSTNMLGMRLRTFREAQQCRLQTRMIDEWKSLVWRGRNLQERQSLWKHQLNRELEGARWGSEQATRLRLSSWFRRWCIAHNKSNHLARDHFRTRLLQKMVISWWKTTIHSKQERVLVEAQQTIVKLSYYHPRQQVYVAQAKSSDNQKKEKTPPKRAVRVTQRDVTSARAESMRKMRRMLDPTECATYSRFYQESGKEASPTNRNTSVAKTAHTPHPEDHRRTCSNHSPSVGKSIQEDPQVHAHSEENDEDSSGILKTEATYYWAVGNHTSQFTSEVLSSRNLPARSVTSNQVRFEPLSARPGTEIQNHPHRDHCSDNSLSYSPKVLENELPLFDNEREIGVGRSEGVAQKSENVVVAKPPIGFVPTPRKEQRLHQRDVFEPVRNNTQSPRHSHPQNPQTFSFESREYEYEIRARSNATPRMFEPTQSLAPVSDSSSLDQQRRPRAVKSRIASHQKRIKAVSSSNNEARPLADILKLSDGVNSSRSKHDDVDDGAARNDPVCDLSALQAIIGFYVDSIMAHAGNNESGDGVEKLRTTQVRVCFRMARDLALFQNDFYIDELQKVYDANFKNKLNELPRNVDRREEQARLEQFLEQLVERHPMYRKYIDLCLRQNYSQSPVPLRALSWLAQHHMRPHISLQKRARARPRKSKAYWIWELMPTDMDMALEKLLSAITKYIRVLGQFFLRQAVQSSSTTDKPQDYRMSNTAFISLMKQVRVFPQLLHRRELENAVRLSCCSSPESEELNFPEFIEALVRCSCNLRWGELDGAKHVNDTNSDDTVIVIKFVMLVFAMEGQGSVLKKRNEDVSAILGFLGQQQKKKQAEKLFRFRKMLADNKRRTRATRNHQPPSVWNQVRLQFSPKTSPTRSPTRSHDTFDELTESWDGGSPRRVSTEPFVFDAQTNEPFDLDLPASQSVEVIEPQSDCSSQRNLARGEHDPNHLDCVRNDETHVSPLLASGETQSTSAEKVINISCRPRLLQAFGREVASLAVEPSTIEEDGSAHDEKQSVRSVDTPDSTVNVDEVALDEVTQANLDSDEEQSTSPMRSTGLMEPMEKDEFLREILDSIGDVELLLNQSQFRGSNYSRHGKQNVQTTHGNHYDESARGIPSLSDLAGDRSLLNYSNVMQTPRSICTDLEGRGAQDEISVRDPMLNYLTDIERFTENPDQTSLISIADMTGLPFVRDSDGEDQSAAWTKQEELSKAEVAQITTAQPAIGKSTVQENTIK